MHPDQWRKLYEYDFWANRHLRQCISGLAAEQLDQKPPHEEWSLRRHLIHLVGVESWWFHFLQTGVLKFLDFDEQTPLDLILAEWDRVEAKMCAYLAALTPEELQRMVHPEFWGAETPPAPVWEALFQVLNHSTDHRAQALRYVKWLGGPTFEQDYLNFLYATPSR
jgi:uncharacterized damage-inducible protein DinB